MTRPHTLPFPRYQLRCSGKVINTGRSPSSLISAAETLARYDSKRNYIVIAIAGKKKTIIWRS